MTASTALLTLFVVLVAGAVTLGLYSLGPLLGRWDRRRPYGAAPAPALRVEPIARAITIESIPPRRERESARHVIAVGTPPTPASVVTPAVAHVVLPPPRVPAVPPARPAKGSVPPPLPPAARRSVEPPAVIVASGELDDGATIEGPRYTVVKSTRSKRR
jgi:hypothetical protein